MSEDPDQEEMPPDYPPYGEVMPPDYPPYGEVMPPDYPPYGEVNSGIKVKIQTGERSASLSVGADALMVLGFLTLQVIDAVEHREAERRKTEDE